MLSMCSFSACKSGALLSRLATAAEEKRSHEVDNSVRALCTVWKAYDVSENIGAYQVLPIVLEQTYLEDTPEFALLDASSMDA